MSEFKVQGPKGEIYITDGLEFPCPGCGQTCSVSFEHSAVMHPMPMCQKFERMKSDDFLKLARKKIREQLPS